MWLLIGICIMVVTTDCADTNGFKNGENFSTNWGGSEPPDIFKLPRKIFFFSTPYNTNAQQWNQILPIGSDRSGRGIATANKIIGNSESKYQIMKLRSSGSSLPEWFLTRNIDNEKILELIEQLRNDDMVSQERRNPAFSPWGGKRSSSPYKADPRIRRPSRVPFNSWGGKRNHVGFNHDGNSDTNAKHFSMVDLPGIKKPFNSWGGKRTPVVIEYLVNVSSIDILKNILQSTHAPPTLISTNKHTKQDSLTDNAQDSSMEDNKVQITFEPWNEEKIDVNSIENDIIVSSAPTLHYTQ